jgi:hypothetical protein
LNASLDIVPTNNTYIVDIQVIAQITGVAESRIFASVTSNHVRVATSTSHISVESDWAYIAYSFVDIDDSICPGDCNFVVVIGDSY